MGNKKKVTKKTVTTTVTEETITNLSTEIIAILDRSGSMTSIINDCIGGFNSFIEEQQEIKDDTSISVFTFDEFSQEIVSTQPIKDMEPLTRKEWSPRGLTSLYDSIGIIITNKEDIYQKEKNAPDRTLVIITTDGEDTSSKEYNSEMVKELIERKRKDGWEFVFTAANQDAFIGALSLGISGSNSVTWTTKTDGISDFFTTLSTATASYRTCSATTTNNFFNVDDDEKK